jgi:putative component of membrane protein insertase Oxa1/YidC/SpoIIIJ protein YidD
VGGRHELVETRQTGFSPTASDERTRHAQTCSQYEMERKMTHESWEGSRRTRSSGRVWCCWSGARRLCVGQERTAIGMGWSEFESGI